MISAIIFVGLVRVAVLFFSEQEIVHRWRKGVKRNEELIELTSISAEAKETALAPLYTWRDESVATEKGELRKRFSVSLATVLIYAAVLSALPATLISLTTQADTGQQVFRTWVKSNYNLTLSNDEVHRLYYGKSIDVAADGEYNSVSLKLVPGGTHHEQLLYSSGLSTVPQR